MYHDICLTCFKVLWKSFQTVSKEGDLQYQNTLGHFEFEVIPQPMAIIIIIIIIQWLWIALHRLDGGSNEISQGKSDKNSL